MISNIIGEPKEILDTPALCLNMEALEYNLKHMSDFFKPLKSKLRPHFKTHKTPIIAHMQIGAGAIGITCAKISEAEILAQSGIKDILIANQIITSKKIQRLVNLAKYADIMVTVDSKENIENIDNLAKKNGVNVRILIEVDVGMHRCGVPPDGGIVELARYILKCKSLRFEGIMGYEGHAVMIKDPQERSITAKKAMGLLMRAYQFLEKANIPVKIISAGGTGTFDIIATFPGVTEIQAGSYITMDTQYRENVGINEFKYALTLLTTVIHSDKQSAITDAGMKSLSTDFGMPGVLHPKGWKVRNLAEEHCYLKNIGGPPLKPGDMVELIPSHGCTTINLHDVYHVIRNGVLEAIWIIHARGKSS